MLVLRRPLHQIEVVHLMIQTLDQLLIATWLSVTNQLLRPEGLISYSGFGWISKPLLRWGTDTQVWLTLILIDYQPETLVSIRLLLRFLCCPKPEIMFILLSSWVTTKCHQSTRLPASEPSLFVLLVALWTAGRLQGFYGLIIFSSS